MNGDPTAGLRDLLAEQDRRIADLEAQVAELKAQEWDGSASPWMRPNEVATFLGVGISTVTAWRQQGLLSTHRIDTDTGDGKPRKRWAIVVPRAEVEALVVPEPGRRRADS